MRFDQLDLNLLVAFNALVEHRGVSAAAKKLNLSQPAVTGALNRLRYYFKDDLLIQVGRQMMLTPKAEALAGPIREALMLIRSQVTAPGTFEPESASRTFSIVTSDYAFNVLVSDVLAQASRMAPGVTFDIIMPDLQSNIRLDRGEVDLLITVDEYILDHHPHVSLFRDEHALICWSEGRYGNGINADEFLEAGHAVAYFGVDKNPATIEVLYDREKIERRVEVRVPIFGLLPSAIIGTDRVATVHRRYAEFFAQRMPVAVLPVPFKLPHIEEHVQWHQGRDRDEGLAWLVGLLTERSRQLPAPKA